MPDAGTPEKTVQPDVAGELAPKPGPQPGAGASPAQQPQAQAAFRAGWLIAQLYGPILDRSGQDAGDHLPSVSGLSREQRVELSMRELDDALATAAAGIDYQADLGQVRAVRRSGTWHEAFKSAIAKLHELLLTELTVKDASLGRAYGLGRSLSDTAWLPTDLASLGQQLNPYRVAELDGWLSDLSALLGQDPVTAVRGSLRTWSDWVASPLVGRRKLNWSRDGRGTELALRRQGAVWHDLLSGQRDPASLLTAEAYVEAADIAVHRVGVLARRVLLHFWYAVAFVLAVAGGLVYVSVAYAAGTGKIWGIFLAAIGGSGALIQGVRRGLSQVAQRAGAPLWQVEKADALQVGATRLPIGATTGHLRRRVTLPQNRRPTTAAPEGAGQKAADATTTPATTAPAGGTSTSRPENGTATNTQPPIDHA
jgi:hypothetical protein